MLEITIQGSDLWNPKLEEFMTLDDINLQMEHSLVSISKWESIHKTPFLSHANKSLGEFMNYFQCMTLTENVNPIYFTQFSAENVKQITEYIGDPMTATTINQEQKKGRHTEVVTAELVYYWMVSLQIPFECQYWHFNRLMMLINVINHKNTPPKKRSKREILSQNRQLNEARRQQLTTSG